MPVSRGELGELLKFLGNGMHGVNLPALLGENRVDYRRSINDVGFEQHDELQQGKVGIRTDNFGVRPEELEVGSLGL